MNEQVEKTGVAFIDVIKIVLAVALISGGASILSFIAGA